MSRQFSVREMVDHNSRIASDQSNDMDDWDRSFSNSIKERYAKYGPNTFLSDKQQTHILRIFRVTGGMSATPPAKKQDKHGFDSSDDFDTDDDIPF